MPGPVSRPLLASSLAMAVAGCDMPGLPGPSPDTCPVLASRDWTAFVNAMPGPGPRPELIVTGQVRLPTAGYLVELLPGPLEGPPPPVQTVELVAIPPAGPAATVVTEVDVRLELSAPAIRPDDPPPYRAVRVVCGDAELAYISPVEVAW